MAPLVRCICLELQPLKSYRRDVPEAVDGREVSGVPDVESGAEDVGLAEFFHLRLGVTNLTQTGLSLILRVE